MAYSKVQEAKTAAGGNMKIKTLVVLFLIMLSAYPAAAWDVDEKSSTGAFSTQSGTYVLAKTLTHTVDSERSLQAFQIQYVVYTTSSTNYRAHWVKVTAQVAGGPETTLSDTYHSVKGESTVQTRNYNFEAAKGQTVTIRVYLHRDGSYSPAYYSLIKNVYSRAYIIEYPPEITATAITADNAYSNTLSYSISGIGTPAYTLYVDDVPVKTGSANWGTNSISLSGLGISQGVHTWYVNASSTQIGQTVYSNTATRNFTYDNINPAVTDSVISPDVGLVAVGNSVSISAKWSDTNMKEVKWYVDTGAGYSLISTTSVSNGEWHNKTISTSGHVGKTIRWQQVGYDQTGNTYTFQGQFIVILDAVQIYVYDEATGTQILPTQIRFFDESLSRTATINSTTKIGTVSYAGLTNNAKYVVTTSADGYYTRSAIVQVNLGTLSRLDVYLVNESDAAIFQKLKLATSNNVYSNSEYIVRLTKPVANSTATVFETYFDFNGIASTFLIANDAYILTVISPTETYNYGWMIPDPDGEVSIVIGEFALDEVEDWIAYTYTESNESVSFEYLSSKAISNASMIITRNGIEAYNTSASTTAGSFTYMFEDNGVYLISCTVNAADGSTFIKKSAIETGGSTKLDAFPDSYSIMAKSVIVMFVLLIGVLGLSSYRSDLACIYGAGLYAVAVYNEWCYGNILSVIIIGIIAVAAIIKFQKKHSRSVM